MAKFNVEKSIFIHAPVQDVQAFVRDFQSWPGWSPWLIAEPDCPLSYLPDGTGYSWDGSITGSGEMRLVRETPLHSITCELTFLKPWKSVNSVRFVFVGKDGGTEVTWLMEGSLPVFMFWMRSMMSAWIGADYQRGLLMLKAVIETGENPSKLAFPGMISYPATRYFSVKTTCPIPNLADHMRQDMEKLTASGIPPCGKPFSICHQWDLAKGLAKYSLALPFDGKPAEIPGGFVAGEIPACKVYQVRHTGPYRFLGNAWAAGLMHGRAKLYASDKKIDPFEIYENDPTKVRENELVTLLHFPVK